MAGDDERGAVVRVVEVVRRDGHGDGLDKPCDGVRVLVARVEGDVPEGGGGEREGPAVRGDDDAVREGDEEHGERVLPDGGGGCVGAGAGVGSERDVRDEPEGQREHGLDDGENVPDVGEAPREEVVVGHVEGVGGGEREGVGGDEVRRGDGTDVVRDGGGGGGQGELLDDGARPGVVDHIEIGGRSCVRGVYLDAQRVEVVAGGVTLQLQALKPLWGRCLPCRQLLAKLVEPERPARLGISQRPHNGVP